MSETAYLDHAATTPMRRAAVDAMLPYLTDHFANPSGTYRPAREARRAVDDARDELAELVGCRAARARRCEPEGLPPPSRSHGSIASTASGRIGVVAAWSR